MQLKSYAIGPQIGTDNSMLSNGFLSAFGKLSGVASGNLANAVSGKLTSVAPDGPPQAANNAVTMTTAILFFLNTPRLPNFSAGATHMRESLRSRWVRSVHSIQP